MLITNDVKVAVTITRLFKTQAKKTARDFLACEFWKDCYKEGSENFTFYETEAKRHLKDFAEMVEIVYPGDNEKVNNMLQLLDEIIEEERLDKVARKNG